jgi:hypothetical protein
MIITFEKRTHRFTAFHTYARLCKYIAGQEYGKYLASPQKAQRWVFARHPYQRVVTLHQFLSTGQNWSRSKAMIPGGLDVLEIVRGDPQNPLFFPISADMDVESMRKKFCQSYCKDQGIQLVEIADVLDFHKIMPPGVEQDRF